MSDDRRKSQRHELLFVGGVAEVHGKKVDCVLRDISETGACIEFDATSKLPDEINLTIPDWSRSFTVKIVWREADRVGITFPFPATTLFDGPVENPDDGRD